MVGETPLTEALGRRFARHKTGSPTVTLFEMFLCRSSGRSTAPCGVSAPGNASRSLEAFAPRRTYLSLLQLLEQRKPTFGGCNQEVALQPIPNSR